MTANPTATNPTASDGQARPKPRPARSRKAERRGFARVGSRGAKWSRPKLDNLPGEREAVIIARVELTRDAPRWTVESIRERVIAAKAAGEDMVELVVHRSVKPPRGKPIRLGVFQGERRRTGPWSSGDADVENAGGYNWRTRWATVELARWLERIDRGR